MNRRNFQIGPGAASLLLIAVVLCMGVLGALSLVSSRGDAKLSARTLRMAESAAQLNVAAEERLVELDVLLSEISDAESDDAYLAELNSRLPEGVLLNGRLLMWEESAEDGRRLACAIEVAPLGEFPRATWAEHSLWTELDEDAWDQLLLLPQ